MDYVFKEEDVQALANLIEVVAWKHAQPIMELLKAVIMRNRKEAEKLPEAKPSGKA